mgnify:CR=1 FL=1
MADKFVVRQKKPDKKEDKSVVMTLEIRQYATIQELDEGILNRLISRILVGEGAAKSDRSRNELMCMALRYALDHLEFIPEAGE